MSKLDELIRALEVNKAVYEAVRKNLKVGVSEQDIYELTKATVDKMLQDVSHEFIGDFVGGKRCGLIGGDATDYKLADGDGFILDLSVRCKSTWSDTCRTFFLGEPSDEIKKAYDTVLKLQSFGASLIKPGICAENVKISAENMLKEMGYGGMMPHHMGHLIGKKPYMTPTFDNGNKETVPAGVFFTLEPGLYKSDVWGLRVENDYVLQPDGAKLLFTYPTEIDYFII